MSTAIVIMSVLGLVAITLGMIGVVLTAVCSRNVEHMKRALIVLCVGGFALLVAGTLRSVAQRRSRCAVEVVQ